MSQTNSTRVAGADIRMKATDDALMASMGTPLRASARPPRGRGFVAAGAALAASLVLLAGCTQEAQNKLGREIQNWTGTNGVLEFYAGDKVVRRFLKIDKLSTAMGTEDGRPRPYRFGYGILDENLNGVADAGEKKVYFEVSDYAGNYIFFESPR